MNKQLLLLTLSLFHFLPIGIRVLAAQTKTARPNVIIVMADDQSYGDLGCHGNPILQSPNLDQMYRESIRFTQFQVSPFCTPTRAALMTEPTKLVTYLFDKNDKAGGAYLTEVEAL